MPAAESQRSLSAAARSGPWPRAQARLRRVLRTLAEIFYGATGFEFERQAMRVRADLENFFIFMIVGELIGVPVLPPYYALRLLPYLVGDIPVWKRRVLRPRDPLETEEFELHGV
jgi:hypothetical protein